MKLQQGDVILISTAERTGGEVLNHLILAEGTATGHKHQIVDGESRLFMVQKFDHKHMTLNVISEYATLQHEEHQSIQIPQGWWDIRIVLEYDHFDEEAREVRD